MKKNRERTASQGSGEPRGKRPPLFVLILCLLLGGSVVISTALLGGSLGRFSREERHVIPLVQQGRQLSATVENTAPRAGSEEGATPSESPAAASGTAAPQPTAAPRRTAEENNNAAARAGEYQGELRIYDALQSWSTETRVDLFKESYSESGSETVKAEDGQKVIAPGTSNIYEFKLENNGNLPLDYTISLKVENGSEPDVPLEWRLLAGDGTALNDWRGYSETAEPMKRSTLDVRRQDSYAIEWRWAFERGGDMDRADTEMGDLAARQPLGAKATIIVYAEEKIEPSGGDGSGPSGTSQRPKTGDACEPGLYVVLMTVSGCGLLLLFRGERLRKKRE